jgi:organic hydroperoxide reductase OsmC/OhrA
MLWFLDLARQAGLDVAAYRDEAVGTMGRLDGRIAIVRITLRPRIEFAGEAPDAERLARLHHAAHERCFIANSLKTKIVVEG